MRILHINAVYGEKSTGRNLKEIHEYCLKNGIESYVAAPYLFGLRANSYKIGCKLDYLVHSLFSHLFGLQGYFSYFSTIRLLKYITLVKPDIIHLNNLHSNYVNLRLLLNHCSNKNIAVVFTLHDSWFYTGKCVYYTNYHCSKYRNGCGNCPALKDGNSSLFFDRSHKMLVDKKKYYDRLPRKAVIGVSNWTRNDASNSILSSSKIITTIFNWVDFEIFNNHDTSELRTRLNLKDKIILLGVSVFWDEIKGINLINELARILPENYVILLIGKVRERQNKNIIYIGEIKDAVILSDYYSMADIFLNPSLRETFGKTTAEAMACGTPVVGLNATATTEVVGIDGTCGILVEKNDTKEYILAIDKVYSNLKQYSDNAYQRALRLFDKNTNISEYINVYKKILSFDGEYNENID